MAGDWRVVTLDEVADEVTVGYVGSMTQEYQDDGIPFLRSKNISPFKINTDDLKYVSPEFNQKIKKSKLKPGDVVIVRTGKPGTCAVIPDWLHEANCSDVVIARCGPSVNERYLAYYVNTAASNHVNAHLVGAVQQHFNVSAAKKMEVLLPPLAEQERIVRVLGAIDDKIALNDEINTTLESVAQALFKSWFMDFDPVIDNALAAGNPIPEPLQARADARAALGNQRKPLPDHIRQQFPDRFVLTEDMGWVPEGWEVTPLSKAIEINPKVAIKKGQKAKHVDMKALPTSGYCVGEVSEKEYAGGAKFERGDVLLARITPCLENGKTGVVDFLADGEPGFGSTEFIVMRPKNAIGTSFLAALARQEAFRQHCISNMVGSSGRQRVQNSCFDTYFVCTPKVPDILKLYRDNCEAWFEKMTTLANESQSLGLLRDTLLPKLLSGELRIPEAKAEVSEAL